MTEQSNERSVNCYKVKKGKQANGEGSIRQRKDGRWELRYSDGFDPVTGKLRSHSFYCKSQADAIKKLHELQRDHDDGIVVDYDKMTVGEWLDKWYGISTVNLRPYTRKSYESDIRVYLKPAFGKILLKNLKGIQVQQAVNDWSRGTDGRKALSPKTVRDIHGTLHKALEVAKQEDLIRTNPADHTRLPVTQHKEIHILTPDDAVRLLEGLKGDLYESVIHMDLLTGMRESEILGLTWDCIDFGHETITVKQQLMKDGQNACYYLDSHTKNNTMRTIPASKTVIAILRHVREEQGKARDELTALGIWKEDIPGLVFTNETGGHLTQATALKHLQRAASRLGLGHIKFHELRHTYASLSIAVIGVNGEGGSIKAVQESLGHASAAFTLKVYAHATENAKRLGAEKLDTLLASAKKDYIQS